MVTKRKKKSSSVCFSSLRLINRVRRQNISQTAGKQKISVICYLKWWVPRGGQECSENLVLSVRGEGSVGQEQGRTLAVLLRTILHC